MKTIRERIKNLPNYSKRKLILFGCHCLREIWHLLKDDSYKKVVETTEMYVDGIASEKDVERVAHYAYCQSLSSFETTTNATVWLSYAAITTNRDGEIPYIIWAIDNSFSFLYEATDQNKLFVKQHQLFDDIFGDINGINNFRTCFFTFQSFTAQIDFI